jgi:2-phosphosulfolactate phosphatase
MGEDRGLPPKGFDFGNSPADLSGHNLKGKTMIQRTSAGTQGIARTVNAEHKAAASFVCAGATIDYIRKINPEKVSFIITGSESRYSGAEDEACADYMEACLRDKNPNPAEDLEKARNSQVSRNVFYNPDLPFFSPDDIVICVSLDLFNFPLIVERTEYGAVIFNHDLKSNGNNLSA